MQEVRNVRLVYGFTANVAFVVAVLFATVWAVWANGGPSALRAQWRAIRPASIRPVKTVAPSIAPSAQVAATPIVVTAG